MQHVSLREHTYKSMWLYIPMWVGIKRYLCRLPQSLWPYIKIKAYWEPMTSSNIPNKDHHFLEMSVWGIKKKFFLTQNFKQENCYDREHWPKSRYGRILKIHLLSTRWCRREWFQPGHHERFNLGGQSKTQSNNLEHNLKSSPRESEA